MHLPRVPEDSPAPWRQRGLERVFRAVRPEILTGPGQPLASGTPRSASRAPHLDLESPRSAVLRFTPAGKNCLDKPRFGGPGVKKKACVNRVCLNADASPPLRPLVCKEAVPSLEGLPDALTRHPLLPLDSQPLAAANLYSAPTPSTGAATNRSKLELLLASHGISLYR